MTELTTMTRLIGRSAPGPITPGLIAPGLIAAGLMALALCSCSSPAHSVAATQNTCQQVSAVLSDGPDPDADPVGYAEAQINPLRHISAPDQALRAAIGQLADAYQEYFTSNGTSSEAKEAVAVASKKVDSICPGATS
jgi:hypothetical protein